MAIEVTLINEDKTTDYIVVKKYVDFCTNEMICKLLK